MRYRYLGSTGIKVSQIAFGGVEIGMPYGLNLSQATHLVQRKEAIQLLHKSLDSGINFYDTARLYGDSEEIMGEAFFGKRDEVVLATKCRHFRLPDGTLPRRSELRDVVYQSLYESLNKLKTDYIDIYMLHHADLEILEIDELYEIFDDLIAEGLIRVPGLSVYNPEETKLALEKGFWKVIQAPFNLLNQQHGTYFSLAKENGVGIVVRSVLMRGLLTDKSFHLHPALKPVQDHIHLYKELFDSEVDSLPDLAMRFAGSLSAISAVLIGIDKQEFLNQAIQSFKGKQLTDGQLKQARSLGYPDPDFLNLAEWDKNGWL